MSKMTEAYGYNCEPPIKYEVISIIHKLKSNKTLEENLEAEIFKYYSTYFTIHL